MKSFLKELLDSGLAALKKFKVVKGRSSRREFWMFVLSTVIVSIILSVLTVIPFLVKLVDIVIFLYGLAIFVPSITAGVRRLHDTNKSGWLMLLGLIPIAGAIVLIVFWSFKGNPGKNRYGPKPKD